MNTLFPTVFLVTQAGMIAALAAAFTLPAMVLGAVGAFAAPTPPPRRPGGGVTPR